MLLKMEISATWVPMGWPEGWSDPSLLDLLKGAPVNCLVVPWGDRKPAAAFLAEGRRRGLAFVGLIEGAGDRAAAIREAQAAHLDAIALDTPAETGLPVIAWGEKSKLNWQSGAAGFAIADGVWPSIPPKDSAEGGPTGAPWVDSNGWMVQLARSLAPGKTVWVHAAPPKEGTIRPENYALAVADAGAYGGRWVVTLDEKLSAALAARNPKALETWKGIARTAAFFEAHRGWADLPPCANIAVISDFTGPNEYVGQELLNLLPRRGVPYRVVDRRRAGGGAVRRPGRHSLSRPAGPGRRTPAEDPGVCRAGGRFAGERELARSAGCGSVEGRFRTLENLRVRQRAARHCG